ncbi:uncharacterized protein EI90DRAFT_3078826 [Cantharellus anzutake]|uniref:uncharacterized protein n=1 Tax=Cantharellus anzutake TaxID=1750568 RepID=UPI00190858E5|nr:uncharacterized protein EI90DRAFT_3078826 [Cantharellus anzutake]KAF8321843.1 hypothetical protein EI90DRAFT_3078826 [Cantharellus anzutake]
MRIECIACPMTISSEVKRSVGARECLCEAQRLSEPGRAWIGIARLPRSRRFLLELQSVLEGSTGQSAAHEGATASLPMTTPLQVPHMQESHAPTGFPDGSPSTTAFPVNYIGIPSAVNEPPYVFPMGTSALNELDPQTQTQFHPIQSFWEEPASTVSTLRDMVPPFSLFNPSPKMTHHFENLGSVSSDTFHHTAIPEQLAGPSRSGPSRIVDPVPIEAALETPDRPRDGWMKTNSNEDVVYWLRGLAQRLGYHLVPI